ncbi:MAG: response regulator [Methylococcales bacterium]|nr:response regulator [Methylococcales bacterium]
MQENGHAVRLLTYHEVLKVLHKKCKEKHTGIMVLKDNQENIAKLAITRGVIIDVIFKGKRGVAALHLIKTIRQAKSTFHVRPEPSQPVARKIELSTDQVFKLLISSLQKTPPQKAPLPTPISKAPPVVATSASMIEEVVAANDTANISEGGMMVIEAQLTILIGPIAKIIFLNYAKDIIHGASDFKKLSSIIEKISKELLTPAQQKLFRHNTLAFISHYALRGHEAILHALKATDKKLRLNNTTLGLLVDKCSTQETPDKTSVNQLLKQIEYAGNLGPAVDLLAMLRFLEKSGETGLLEVREKNKAGGFYFDKGLLINAVECGMNGKIIAMDILQWNHDYLIFKAIAQKKVSRQIQQTVDMLAKEIDLLKMDESNLPKKPRPNYSPTEESALMSKAIEFAGGCKSVQAENILTALLTSNGEKFEAWLWLSRVLTNMSAIEITLKKAVHIHAKNADVIQEIKKFTQARKTISTDFVIRCPFCWAPIAEKDTECHHCHSSFAIESNFFKTLGKANTELLDQAINRYSQILKKTTEHDIYLHFYLLMAYLNRKYFEEALNQFDVITQLAPKNSAFMVQKRMLVEYMDAEKNEHDTAPVTKKITTINQSNQGIKARILVIEDSMVTRKVIVRTLESSGYEVHEAKNGFEALNSIDRISPDIILLDIILPGKDGYEILDDIRQKPIFEKTPVIMLTSRDSLLDKFKGKVSSANEYLTKPFQPDELLKVVHKYFSITQLNILADYRKEEINNSATITQDSSNKALAIQTDKQSSTTILVVEDSLVTRKVIARTLTARGYQVIEASNATEALTDIEQKKPDLILLDIILPGKNGYEILEEIKAKPMFEKTPVVMLTSRDGLFDKLKGKVAGANEYLTKPFQPDELLTVVRKYLR